MKDTITLDNIKATYESYVEALEQVYAMAPSLRVRAGRDCPFPVTFEVDGPLNVGLATNLYGEVKESTEFSHLAITPGKRGWDSEFVAIRFYAYVSYTLWSRAYGWSRQNDDESWDHEPAKDSSEAAHLTVELGRIYNIGLHDWPNVGKPKLLAQLEGIPSSLQPEVDKIIERADRQYDGWLEKAKALRDLTS